MKNIFDHLKYDNIPYNELTNEEAKKKLELFAEKIREHNLESTILEYPICTFNPRDFKELDPPHYPDFVSNYPKDLYDKLMVMWVKLFHEPHQQQNEN